MNKSETYLDFCARSYWGRWNHAILKIAVLFLVASVLVFAAMKSGLLLGDMNNASVLIIALMVTAVTVGVGLMRKKKII